MSNTGYLAYTNLEQYYTDSGAATGVTKTNNVSDPDYIAPVLNLALCPLPSVSPSVSMTPSVTPSISLSISATPSVTPTVTPSVSITPSVTPSVSITPSNTPSISISVSTTPSVTVTPSITPSPSSGFAPVVISVNASIQPCIGGSCDDYLGWSILLDQNVLVDTYYTLNIDLYQSGIYAYTYTAGGIIPAGLNYNNIDACLTGAYIGCNYTVNSVCVSTIDAPVNDSTFGC